MRWRGALRCHIVSLFNSRLKLCRLQQLMQAERGSRREEGNRDLIVRIQQSIRVVTAGAEPALGECRDLLVDPLFRIEIEERRGLNRVAEEGQVEPPILVVSSSEREGAVAEGGWRSRRRSWSAAASLEKKKKVWTNGIRPIAKAETVCSADQRKRGS